MKKVIFATFLASVISCAGGTETGNPATLKSFTSSSCKTRSQDPGQQALVLASDAEGLQCVEWVNEGNGLLTLRLLNFPESCGDKYLGTAELASDGSLQLAVHKDSCAVTRCGSCVFDFGFELARLDLKHALALQLGSAICATEPTTFDETFTLPLDQTPNGVVCRYLGRGDIEQYALARGACGERNMPCGGCTTDVMNCNQGLTCAEISSGDSRCLATCVIDDDCAGGLMTCQQGLCESNASW